jgi:hypothetical protein
MKISLLSPRINFVLFLILTIYSGYVCADQEASNRVYVTSSEWGQFYAKSIPSDSYGTKGKTIIFRVEKDIDTEIITYDWYSTQIFIASSFDDSQVYVVTPGPWSRAQVAEDKAMALQIYKGKKLIKAFTNKDFASLGGETQRSKSHFTIIESIIGFTHPYGNKVYFNLKLHGGKTLILDLDTGLSVSQSEIELAGKLYSIAAEISTLKYEWYVKNGKNNDTIITEEMLKKDFPSRFPVLPPPHKYIPNSIWQPVEFKK